MKISKLEGTKPGGVIVAEKLQKFELTFKRLSGTMFAL
jgi:hypothetical protein